MARRHTGRYIPSKLRLMVALFWIIFPLSSWSQTQLTTVYGFVTDTTRQRIPGARVTIADRATGLIQGTWTDSSGQYHLAGLPQGHYTIQVEREGFERQTQGPIPLASGATLTINFVLAISELPQQITVSAGVVQIDNTTSAVGGLVTRQELTELPLDGRSLFQGTIFQTGVLTTPSSSPSLLSSGKDGQAAINGMRSSWTSLLIDGIDANDPVFGWSPGGASGLFLGLDEFAEVRVLTQTPGAEYGRSAGGVIDAITRSGTNEFHGSLAAFYRGASLDARNYFDLGSSSAPQFVRNQFGANLGGPLAHNRTFFFAGYEGLRQVQASTAIATVPDELAHRGLLPSSSDSQGCSIRSPRACVAVGVDPRIQPVLNLLPYPNGPDHGDGTADLISADKGNTNQNHGMIRVDHRFSTSNSMFARYIIDDGASVAPYFGTPPGAYVPGFPTLHRARNQFASVQDNSTLWHGTLNQLRVGVNRTTASTSDLTTVPGLSTSLLPNRPFGMIDVGGISLIGNAPATPLGDFSTVYQVSDQMTRIIGRHTLKFGADFQRLQSNSLLDFTVNGLYTFGDLGSFGLPSKSNNPALEFFLKALPLSYIGADPSNSDSHRSYRQNAASAFAQDFVRITQRVTLNIGLRYDYYSNPTEAHERLSAIRDPLTDSGPTTGKVFAHTPADLFSPQAGFAWNIFGDGKTVVRGGAGLFRDSLPVFLYGLDRFLSPFFAINSFVLPNFLHPNQALLKQPINLFNMTYNPHFPYAIQYNLNLERNIGSGIVISAGYFGARGNHLTRQTEVNPFEPATGERSNPNLSTPLLTDLTDGQSFYNSLQASVRGLHKEKLSWQISYTLSHSVDDASINSSVEAVNEPPMTQDPFNRKGSRGRSGFDIRHNFAANFVYDLPFGEGPYLRNWQLSGTAMIHSNVPFTPVLAFDNAEVQSLLIAERPDLVGDPDSGVCPNGSKVRTPSCWFNPNAFALPAPGQFGNAGRNILRGPSFAQCDLALQKSFQLAEGRKIALRVDAYNLLNHPNFGVPTNTQSPLTSGGSGDAIFADPTGRLAGNVARILTTVGTGRQIQIGARFTF